MHIVCKTCGQLNPSDGSFCISCNKPLRDSFSILKDLLKKQETLEQRHQQELEILKEEISALRDSLTKESPVKDVEEESPAIEQTAASAIPQPAQISVPPKPIVNEVKEDKEQLPKQNPATFALKETPVYEPNSFQLGVRKLLEPLYAGIDLLGDLYDKYKTEGKLPIFFMTIAGILAILFGFGYLLQYSLKYLGDYAQVVKIGLGFAFSFGVGGIGIRLYRRNENYQEYGSALISLGLILNYLLIYFLSDLGNFPILSSGILGFSLIILNTLIAILLSLKFKTKIIAVLFLLGGSLAPLYLNSSSDGSLYYLYLLLLTIGANVVAQRIEWKSLHYLSFIVSLGLLELMVFSNQPSTLLFTVYYHLYAYLFFYYSIFNKFKIRKALEKYDILLLAGNLSLFVFNLYSSHPEQYTQLGLLYGLNALIFGFTLARFRKSLDPKIKVTFFIIIGSFIGFAIPALVHQSLMGLFWSIEAIALILLGFTYNINLVRKEGYIVLLIAFAKLAFSSSLLIDNWFVDVWHEGFLNYAVLGLVITALWFIGQKFTETFDSLESSLFDVFKEIIPLWLSSVFLIAAYGIIEVWALNLALIPAFGLIYWHKKLNTRFTDKVALFHFLLLIISVANSVIQTGSIHLSDQLLYAKVSLIELMASLWFFRKYFELLNYKEARIFGFAHTMRISFFVLLPLIIIHISRRHAIEFISSATWLAFLVSYFLHKKLQYKALLIETNFLAIAAILISLMSLNTGGLSLSILLPLMLMYLENGHSKEGFNKSPFKELLIASPYAIAFSAAILNHQLQNENFGGSAAIFSLILFVGIHYKNKIAVMQKSAKVGMRMASFINLFAIGCTIFEESFLGVSLSGINLVIFGLMLQNKGEWYPRKAEPIRWTWAVIAHQLQMLLFYALALILLDIDLNGILATVILVTHAILVLFVSLKNQLDFLNKVSFGLFGIALLKIVFNDIRGFETAEKIVVLIVIGVLLLGASYAYLKLKKHFENQRTNEKSEPKVINNDLSKS
jgi:hypothetical protein